jgi:para-aminobenzoate synthetase/4-amino-4-deoxychorismate lyase
VNQRSEALIQIAGGHWLRFQDPVRILVAERPDQVSAALTEVERLARGAGLYAVGFVSYEAAGAYGLSVEPMTDATGLPLVWFGLFTAADVAVLSQLPITEDAYTLGVLEPSIDRSAYDRAVARIKEHLAEGDTYQVNYTFRMEAAFAGDARSLFTDLVTAQGGQYSAFINLGSHSICSASPELFFSREDGVLSARPMKGTSPRGRTVEEDRGQRDRLRASAKQRAENVMIVDMVRNDLGRIAEVGSVQVPELFTVERYPNVWQMTSQVTARSAATLADLFAALHPSASVTGAPKVRTMEILRELEGRPRGIYTGAIGYLTPDGAARFNVAIRTAVIDHRAQTLSFGIGSGIVWDSTDGDEYAECLLKGSILGRRPVQFDLLETMRWSAGEGFFLLERHLSRMRDSAEYFEFVYDETAIRAALAAVEATLTPAVQTPTWRVRLLLARTGETRTETDPLGQPGHTAVNAALARDPVDASDPFLFHKTTRRDAYRRARIDIAPGCDEAILWNARREVTEATTANLVVELDGALVTPPIECGLLGGTLRGDLLAKGQVREGIVSLDQLRSARRLWVVNSVQGWREARLIESGLVGQAAQVARAGRPDAGDQT